MYKKGAILFSLLALTACGAHGDKPDWAKDCDKNFSESSREHAECEARVAEQNAAEAAARGDDVSLTREGHDVGLYEGGKEAEVSE